MSTESKNAQAAASAEPRIADTIEAAAGMTGYSETFIRALKGQGLPCFRSGRIYVDELEAHIADHPEEMEALERQADDIDGMDNDLKRERVRKIRLANDQAAGLLLPKSAVAAQVEQLGNELKNLLRRSLEDDLPRELVGKNEDQIRTRLIEVVDDIVGRFHDGTEWTRK